MPASCIVHLLDLDRMQLSVLDTRIATRTIVRATQQLGFGGLAVTMPCKQFAREAVDSETEAVRVIGAVNCITFHEDDNGLGMAIGHNVDWLGAKLSMQEGLGTEWDTAADSICVVGAGGVARAVCFALVQLRVREVFVVNEHDPTSAASLVADLQPFAEALVGYGDAATSPKQAITQIQVAKTIPRHVNGLVNGTPVGMTGGPSGLPVHASALDAPNLRWVFDTVCYPSETPLLNAAAQRGLLILQGGRMNLHVRRALFSCCCEVPVESCAALFDGAEESP